VKAGSLLSGSPYTSYFVIHVVHHFIAGAGGANTHLHIYTKTGNRKEMGLINVSRVGNLLLVLLCLAIAAVSGQEVQQLSATNSSVSITDINSTGVVALDNIVNPANPGASEHIGHHHLTRSYDNISSVPEIFIIGAAKCATTSLHELLGRHPDICKEKVKEKHYFDEIPKYFRQEHRNPLETYQKLFRRKSSDICKYHIDSTPAYIRSPNAIINMNETFGYKELGKKKFILILREPTARECSWYQHFARGCMTHLESRMKATRPDGDKGGRKVDASWPCMLTFVDVCILRRLEEVDDLSRLLWPVLREAVVHDAQRCRHHKRQLYSLGG
jgi:hypothetical protein